MPEVLVLNIPGLAWDTGAPEPLLLKSENRCHIGFNRRADEVQDSNEICVAEFGGCSAVTFGFPNDEVQHGHSLWSQGLQHYRAHEVRDSEWLRDLRAIERHYSQALLLPFADSKHFVLTFHDFMLEAAAER